MPEAFILLRSLVVFVYFVNSYCAERYTLKDKEYPAYSAVSLCYKAIRPKFEIISPIAARTVPTAPRAKLLIPVPLWQLALNYSFVYRMKESDACFYHWPKRVISHAASKNLTPSFATMLFTGISMPKTSG